MKIFTKSVALLLSVLMVLTLSAAAFATNDAPADTEAASATGIIDASEMQKMLDDYVAQYSLDSRARSLCVGFCYLKTGDMWFYNEDKWCYSASLYKVPVSMLCAQKEMAGEITADTRYENQYNTGTLDQLEMKALVNSDNDAGHALVQWMGGTYAGKCADQIIQFTDLPESYFNQDFFSVSYYNVNFFTQVLRTLYNNQQDYPRILNYMKQMKVDGTTPDLSRNLGGAYEVAQKYGSFEETKTNPTKNNKHVGGIIYTPNPIAVTILTVNVDNYPERIAEVAKMLTDYALTLDSRYASYQAEQARLAQEEAARAAQAEQERLAAEAAARQAQQAALNPVTPDPNVSIFVNNPSTDNGSASSGGSGSSSGSSGSSGFSIGGLKALFDGMESTQKIIIIAGVAVFVVGILLLIIALIVRLKRGRDDDYDDYDDYDSPYDDDYDDRPSRKAKSAKAKKTPKAPVAPAAEKRKSSGRKMSKREEEYYDDLPAENVSDDEFYYDPKDYEQAEGDYYEDEASYDDGSYDDGAYYEDGGQAYDDGGYDEADYADAAYGDQDFAEEFTDDQFDDQNYLDGDFLDDSDFEDFKDYDSSRYDT